jgi:hypothetical protein
MTETLMYDVGDIVWLEVAFAAWEVGSDDTAYTPYVFLCNGETEPDKASTGPSGHYMPFAVTRAYKSSLDVVPHHEGNEGCPSSTVPLSSVLPKCPQPSRDFPVYQSLVQALMLTRMSEVTRSTTELIWDAKRRRHLY